MINQMADDMSCQNMCLLGPGRRAALDNECNINQPGKSATIVTEKARRENSQVTGILDGR